MSQDVPNLKSLLEETQTAYFRFRRRLGQRYSHAYFRRVPAAVAQRLRLRVKFYETPPGSIFKASIAAGASMFLTYVAAALIGQGKDVAGDFSILILTVPAGAATFIGFETFARQLVGGTLVSRFSSILTILTSVSASGLYLAQAAGFLRTPEEGYILLGVHDETWLVLILIAFLNWAWTTYWWFGRSMTYFWLANRRIQRGQEVVTALERG